VNFAHSTPENHRKTVQIVRDQANDLGRLVGVLADLPGPKMRTGPIAGEEVTLETGGRFVLTDEPIEGNVERVSTSLEKCGAMVNEGDEIFLADGAIVLRTLTVEDSDVVTEVLRGGVLRSRKGMHIPKAERRVRPSIEADARFVELALGLEVDFIGLSFVRDAHDVRRVENLLPRGRRARPMLVAKIETSSALEHLDEIVAAVDAVMVARGDLGIQTPLTRVPLVQKEIIARCNRAGKPVITATQMLESMTRSPLPTRAEVADVANAVVDGTDALMLSEETAVGDYPVASVETMAETATVAESWPSSHNGPQLRKEMDDPVSWAIARAGVQAAEDLGVAAIVCPTRGGSTPRRVAAFRPDMPIVALSKRTEVTGTLTLMWGVSAVVADPAPDPKEAREDVQRAVKAVVDAGIVASGDLVLVVAGSPGPRAGRTDYVRVVRA
jgi:pyruvate kinase